MSVNYIHADGIPVEDDAPRAKPQRNVAEAMLRGMMCRCPSCGQGKLFSGFLTVAPVCQSCGTELHHHRADDAPPYFTITIVGHIIIPAMMAVEMMYRPAVWIHMVLWLSLTVILSLAFLRPVKGALVGLQWALYMHGFDPDAEDDLPVPEPVPSPR
ncbi:DUF983 domain-containing protein [Microvirga tunisiensis]|uniref:DUF983 domain-containing protein n=2 Tax=Pannonibacter tanglangensis TaxID=2750084 RepID=A0A7X5F0A4_9HYPH|nr:MULTISPECIES: DUF983 domain-containing protein [unclassified Pannonibacter]NBN63760.1 DUF983 domain-containing protein [Pannonibacter sp. XCT-34]NBN77407.1 DUF983 domain-containing protein [Pannonibacter sp. XCT-53]